MTTFVFFHTVILSEIDFYKIEPFTSRELYRNIYKEKQRGCPLLDANNYTHIYIKYI